MTTQASSQMVHIVDPALNAPAAQTFPWTFLILAVALAFCWCITMENITNYLKWRCYYKTSAAGGKETDSPC